MKRSDVYETVSMLFILVGYLAFTTTVVFTNEAATFAVNIGLRSLGIGLILSGLKYYIREVLFPDYLVIPKIGGG